jgi:EAL domain-containing protein (putative c-di-GMP-specific phosphodiesterase class I)
MKQPAVRHFIPRSGLPPQFRETLFDPVTSLPTLPLLLPLIKRMLGEHKQMGLLSLSVGQYTKFEEVYGWQLLDEIVRGVASCLHEIKDECMREQDVLAELTISGNTFLLLMSPPRHRSTLRYRDLSNLRKRIYAKLAEFLKDRMNPDIIHGFGYFIGCSVIKKEASVRLERLVYRTMEEALADANSEKEKELRRKSLGLAEILDGNQISSVFQPIVDLVERRVLGHEAFIRGPKGEFEKPDVLFKLAYEAELIWRLERLSRAASLKSVHKLKRNTFMFLNVEPSSIFDPALVKHEAFRKHSHKIVLEITERAAVTDFRTFREAVHQIKKLGVKVSIDDVGSAYSGLRLIAAINPDFIKLDMELTRGVQDSRIKTKLITAITRFSKDAEIPLIVEGVETNAELLALKRVGVRYAQGFLFGRPGAVLGRGRTYIPKK